LLRSDPKQLLFSRAANTASSALTRPFSADLTYDRVHVTSRYVRTCRFVIVTTVIARRPTNLEIRVNGRGTSAKTVVAKRGRAFVLRVSTPVDKLRVVQNRNEENRVSLCVSNRCFIFDGAGRTHYETHGIRHAAVPVGVVSGEN